MCLARSVRIHEFLFQILTTEFLYLRIKSNNALNMHSNSHTVFFQPFIIISAVNVKCISCIYITHAKKSNVFLQDIE